MKWAHCGGSVGITRHPGRGCEVLSGQPEVLPGHLPPGVWGRHMGEAEAPPTPSSPLMLAEEERADFWRLPCWLRPFWPRKGSCSQAPLPRNCSPCLALGRSRGRGCRGTPSPAKHPGLYIFKGKEARSRRASAHVTSSFFPNPPTPTPLLSPTSRPARGGLGGVFRIHLWPPNVLQQPTPCPLDSGWRSRGTRCGRGVHGPVGPRPVALPGRLEIRNNKQRWGFRRHGEGERLSFLARALFSLVSLKVGC